MNMSLFLAGAASLACGCIVCVFKHIITSHISDADPTGIMAASLVRHCFNLVFFVLAWCLSNRFGFPTIPVLCGTALGLTVPTLFLLIRKHKLFDTNVEKSEDK